MNEKRGTAARLPETLKSLVANDRSARLFLVVALLVIAVGVALRVVGYFGGIELWWDEAMWAMFIAQDKPAGLRPPGYVWVSQWLIELRNTEPVIRSVSLVAGILSLPVFLAMCRRAGLTRLTSVFGLFVLAVQPAAIDLTKEFKPYALELFLHLLLLWLAFSFLRSRDTRWLAALILAATLSAAFSWSIAVVYPGLFALVALSVLRRHSLRQLLAILGGALATIGVLITFVVQHREAARRAATGIHKFDVFYLDSDIRGHAWWLLEKTLDVASFPARLETFWLGPRAVEVSGTIMAGLCVIGVIAVIAARRWDQAALWLAPWLTTMGLNVLGWWPYGVFRTNLFLLAYSLPVALAGLDGLGRFFAARRVPPPSMGRLLVPAFCAAFALVFLPLDIGFFQEGKGSGAAGNCHMHQALKTAYEAERDEAPPAQRRRFIAGRHAHLTYNYYTRYHPVARERYRDFFEERYRLSKRGQGLAETIDRQAQRGFWLVVCRPVSVARFRQYVRDRCPEVDHVQEFRHGGLMLRCRGDAQ